MRLLVLHDDAEREFDYTTGAEDTPCSGRSDHGWTVVSIKDDWATVFADRLIDDANLCGRVPPLI